MVVARLGALRHGMEAAALPREWGLVVKALKANPGRVNAEILELLPVVMSGLRDPKLYAEVIADAWTRAARANTDVNAALLAMARESGKPIQTIAKDARLGDGEFFAKHATRPEYIDDHANGETLHRALSHLLQDLVVDRALKRAGKNVTSPAFRGMLGRAEGVVHRHAYGTIDARTFRGDEMSLPTGDYVWRFTYDLFMNNQQRHLPQPEEMAPIFTKALGLR